MSVSLLLVSLTAVPKGTLSRDLRFGKLAAIEFTSALASGGLAVIAALAGAGYWALVVQQTTMLAIRLVLVMFSARFFPLMVFDREALASVVSFSAYVLGFSLINYWARNADNLLIGRVLGPQELGYYSQAYGLMVVPQLLLTGILQTVIHPVFSAFQHDSSRSRLAYLRLLELLLPVSGLLAIYMYFMAPEIIGVVLGPGWGRSVPVLRWLAAASALQPVAALSGPVLLARNREKWYFGMGVVSTLIFVAGFLVSVQHGIIAVATSYVVTNLVLAPAVILLSYRVACGGKAQDLFRPALSAFVLSSVLGLVLSMCRRLIGEVEPALALGIAAAPLGLLVLPRITAEVRHWAREEAGW